MDGYDGGGGDFMGQAEEGGSAYDYEPQGGEAGYDAYEIDGDGLDQRIGQTLQQELAPVYLLPAGGGHAPHV
jgi:hypothetical protein